MSFALTIREGNGRGQRFRFAGDRVSIGRGAENDVVLNDAGVSRAHARIERRGAIWVLLDRGSANGTQLNGAPLAAMAQLQEADRIRVGTVTFEFRDLGERSGSGAGAPSPPARWACRRSPASLSGPWTRPVPGHLRSSRPPTTRVVSFRARSRPGGVIA